MESKKKALAVRSSRSNESEVKKMNKGTVLFAVILLIQMLLLIAATIALCFNNHEVFQDLLIFHLLLHFWANRAERLSEQDSSNGKPGQD